MTLQTFPSKRASPTQNDLRRPVVTRGDDGRVVLMVEGGAAEVNEPHGGVADPPLAALLEEQSTTRAVELGSVRKQDCFIISFRPKIIQLGCEKQSR